MSWISFDGKLILAARAIRTFAYGYLSVLLGLHLERAGFAPWQVGAVLTATLAGSAALTIIFSLIADRYGRRRMLRVSAVLMAVAGTVFAATTRYPWLILASLTGTIGATSGEVGPFLSLEQAMLPQTVTPDRRNTLFGVYNTVGAAAGSLGALFAGMPTVLERAFGVPTLAAFRTMFVLYAVLAGAALLLFTRLSDQVELPVTDVRPVPASRRLTRGRFLTLTGLFGLDSLAGGFVVQSLIALWFHLRWSVGPEVLGPVFFGVGVLQAASFLVAAKIANRIGLINTMVFTHLPSNVLLMLVPVAPTLGSAIVLLLARHALSQMDVPARQSYVVAVVEPTERTGAVGMTNVIRNVAQAVSPILAGSAMVVSLGLPFFISGGLKIVYDLALYTVFRHIRPPEEVR